MTEQKASARETEALNQRMSREGKLMTALNQAAQANVELAHTKAAFAKLREQLIEAWQATDPRDDKGREKLWIATTQLTQVEKTLRNTVQNGVAAQHELDAIRRAGEPKRLFRRS